MNRRESMPNTQDINTTNDPQKKYRLGTVSFESFESLLFAPLAVRVYTGCSAFLFYTSTKPLIRLHIKYKTVFPQIINNFYILDIFNKM